MKELCPVILPSDNRNTEINPLYVAYMHQIAIGTRPDEIGLTEKENKQIVNNIKSTGIDFPVGGGWFAGPNQRKIIHALDEGAETYRDIEEKTGIPYNSVKVEVSALRKPYGERRPEGMEIHIKKGEPGYKRQK